MRVRTCYLFKLIRLAADSLMKTRSGSMYFPLEFFTQAEIKELIDGCAVIQTKTDFRQLVRNAMENEFSRVLDANDEDDLDGWELEDTPEVCLSGQDDNPFDGPLSSVPSSRSSSPLPSTASLIHSTNTNTASPSEASSVAFEQQVTRRGQPKKRKRNNKTKARNKEYSKRRRMEKHAAAVDAQANDARNYYPPRHALKKLGEFSTVETSFDAADLHSANGGFIGKRLGVPSEHSDLQAHLRAGSRLIKWDGR